MLNGKRILVTGGTGSFGKAFSKHVLEMFPEIKSIVVYSRDELKQFEMDCQYPFKNNPKVRFFLGDIRDKNRLKRALESVDIVIHAAALKQVPAAEYNPMECIKTNIIGAQNLLDAVFEAGVSKVVALSTDKAAAPVNLYGATKLVSDKLITAANNMKGDRDLRLSVVRYGNVLGSRGSLVPYFLKLEKTGSLPITDPKMTRFSISLADGVDMVLWALKNMEGGEIFVPKIPSYRVVDVAEAISATCEKPVVGVRPGEKLHEEMITADDISNTVDLGKYYAVLPSYCSREKFDQYKKRKNGKSVSMPLGYNSRTNTEFLSVAQLRALIANYRLELQDENID